MVTDSHGQYFTCLLWIYISRQVEENTKEYDDCILLSITVLHNHVYLKCMFSSLQLPMDTQDKDQLFLRKEWRLDKNTNLLTHFYFFVIVLNIQFCSLSLTKKSKSKFIFLFCVERKLFKSFYFTPINCTLLPNPCHRLNGCPLAARIAIKVSLVCTQSIMDSPQGLRVRGHSYISINVVLISIFQLGTSQESCRIYSGLGEPCIFPYILNGEFYAECTTDFKKDSTDPMCPIRLTNDITLETSQDPKDWGRCAKKCDLQECANYIRPWRPPWT